MASREGVVRIGRAAAWTWTAVQVGRAVLLAPVLGLGSLIGTVAWTLAPGLAAGVLWRWSSTPGTRLHRARERALLSAARTARRTLL